MLMPAATEAVDINAAATLAPTAAENLPATQLVQAVDRTTWPYFPASQSIQTEAPAAEYLPSAQLVQLEAPIAAENVPAVQMVQAEAPVNAMYVPAGHNKQVVADAEEDPVCPYFPAEHRVPEHVEFTAAPTAAEYVPDLCAETEPEQSSRTARRCGKTRGTWTEAKLPLLRLSNY